MSEQPTKMTLPLFDALTNEHLGNMTFFDGTPKDSDQIVLDRVIYSLQRRWRQKALSGSMAELILVLYPIDTEE